MRMANAVKPEATVNIFFCVSFISVSSRPLRVDCAGSHLHLLFFGNCVVSGFSLLPLSVLLGWVPSW